VEGENMIGCVLAKGEKQVIIRSDNVHFDGHLRSSRFLLEMDFWCLYSRRSH
jgi:hypothetical protein